MRRSYEAGERQVSRRVHQVAKVTSRNPPSPSSRIRKPASFRQLIGRASVGDVFASVIERRATTGETAELQTHCKLQGNEMPLSMLRGVEKRATTTTAANTQINEQPVIAPVFALGDAAFMNVTQETVEPGAAVWPVLSVRPSSSEGHTPIRQARRKPMEPSGPTYSVRSGCPLRTDTVRAMP